MATVTGEAMTAPAGNSTLRNALRASGRNLGWLVAGRGVQAVLSLFYLGFATRSLGVVNFGRFALITGAAQVLATLVAFQTWQIVVQYGMAPAHASEKGRLGRLLRGCVVLDAAGALVGAVLAIVILANWGESLGIGPTLRRATFIFTAIQLITVRSTPVGILRLRDRFSWAAFADSMTPVARFFGALIVMVVHPTVQGFLVAWAVAEVITAAAYWIAVAATGDLKLFRANSATLAQLRAENPGIVRFALSTNASASLGLASKQVPLLAVGAVLGPAAAGSFRLASQLAQALAKISQMLSRAAFPEVVRAVKDARNEALRRVLKRLMLASAAAGVVILALVALIGRQVLMLVGGKVYGHAFPVLMWMAAAGCVELVAISLDTLLTVRGRAASVFMVRAIGVLVITGSAILLLPAVGANGMAMAVLAGSLAVVIMLAAVARHDIRRRDRSTVGSVPLPYGADDD